MRLAWAEFQADVEVDERSAGSSKPPARRCERQSTSVSASAAAEHERQQALEREQADRLAIVVEIEPLSGPTRRRSNRRIEGAVGRAAADAVGVRRVVDATIPGCLAERSKIASAGGCWPKPRSADSRRSRPSSSSSPRRNSRSRMWSRAGVGCAGMQTCCANMPPPISWPPSGSNAPSPRSSRRRVEYQQARARQEQENLRRLQQFCRQVEALAAAEPLTLKAGDRALREIRSALEDRAPLPSKRDRQEIQARLEEARAKLAPRVQELRDADEWQRWANLQVQEEICREMEALKAEENLEVAARRMRELQARWKQVALAPRAQGEAMWRRFKTAQDEVYARTSAFFAAQNEERAGNLVRKQALCDRAEALAGSTDWVKTASEIQALQAEWKTIGPVARGHEKAIWERFRRACDQFFTRRQEDLKHRKEEWAGNLARKEALCVAGRGNGRVHGVGSVGGEAETASGRVEEDRSGPEVEVRSHLAAFPCRLRPVLRSLQASRSGRAAGKGGRSRDA